MGKKTQKKQPKMLNAANLGHPQTEKTISETSQPASTLGVDTSTPATTQVSYFDFITLATIKDIKDFLKLANTTPEGKNLEYLWR